jgi:hypothetical protein
VDNIGDRTEFRDLLGETVDNDPHINSP